MSIDTALEDIAMGESDVQAASRTIATRLQSIDDDGAHELYEALRSWLWKALEARRRDEELAGWLDILGRVSSHLSDRWENLAMKLDGFAELLHASIMLAGAPARRDLSARSHVREMLSYIHGAGGRSRRRELVERLGLKDANLSRVAAPLQDEGWLQREVAGREVFYRLTEKGRNAWLSILERESRVRPRPSMADEDVIRASQGKLRVVPRKDPVIAPWKHDDCFHGYPAQTTPLMEVRSFSVQEQWSRGRTTVRDDENRIVAGARG